MCTEGKYCHERKFNSLSDTKALYFNRPGQYLLYCMVKINGFIQILWCSRITMRFGKQD